VSASSSDPADILNWRRVDARLSTSGQPNDAQLAALKDAGVSHVVNLAPHSNNHALADEPGTVAALGMGYTNIPVDWDEPTEADYQSFRDAMRGLEGQTVHVHCAANMRVSAFLYRYWRDELGRPDEEARAVMDTIWQPGGKWAALIGDDAAVARDHRYAGRDF
jgi:protein tyrosine phosphatase (PTP) superfamily phosphohydrolase (DUF442 family)